MAKFYNTTDETRSDCLERVSRNYRQDQIILEYFKARPGVRLTPFEVLEGTSINAPITSVRRTISNLTKAGKLIKTPLKKVGRFGANNYTWELAVEMPGFPVPEKVKQADALKDVLLHLIERFKADSGSNPQMVFSDDQAKKYLEELKGTIVMNGYVELLPMIQ